MLVLTILYELPCIEKSIYEINTLFYVVMLIIFYFSLLMRFGDFKINIKEDILISMLRVISFRVNNACCEDLRTCYRITAGSVMKRV